MHEFENFLQAIGYHAAILKSLLPMYLHLILSALFPIFTGAHASLCRPSSAAKPPKKAKNSIDDAKTDDSEAEQKMEGLSPMDALLFPITGGMTLVGLYYLIKYLEDPDLLNKILNWYLALFGAFSFARLLTDTMGTIWSFLFPNVYQQDGEIWKVDSKARKAWATKKTQLGRESPLPHCLANLSLSSAFIDTLWRIKAIPSHKFRIQAYIHNNVKANFNLGLFSLVSFAIAVAVELYFNLIAMPWWLTNLLGFSVSYTVLQIMSPTTAWTGTLVMCGLFFYDIYFVFFTPVMVTVATKIDIPAKLVFPRPGTKDLSMLGLGDVVLPGMIIGFALRFDLFLFYLRKQKNAKTSTNQHEVTQQTDKDLPLTGDEEKAIVKAKYVKATGGWGDRFWTPGASRNVNVEQGGNFPKPYFCATLLGYVIGMLFTLGIMQVFGHAQPALLYLVPGVLGALWGTAVVRGEVKTLWNFSEADEEDEGEGDKKDDKKETAGSAKSNWMDWVFVGRLSKKLEKEKILKEDAQKDDTSISVESNGKATELNDKDEMEKKHTDAEDDKAKSQKWDGQLVSFSISLS